MIGSGISSSRLPAGVAEHHALVAGALLGVQPLAGGNALRDIGRLLVQRDQHAAGTVVEAVFGVVVADVGYDLAHDPLDVYIGFGGNFAGDHDLAGGDHRFAGHPRIRVLLEHGIENGVRNLVGDLVGMTFGHRFGGKEIARHGKAFPSVDSVLGNTRLSQGPCRFYAKSVNLL